VIQPVKPGDILDRKIVAYDPTDGTSMEWRLIASEYGSEWHPFHVNNNTGEILRRPKWMALPGGQHKFLTCDIFEVLLAGNRGGGKTLTLLFDFASDVGKGYSNNWRGILFRRTYGDLDDVVRKVDAFFPQLFPGFRFLRSKSEYMALWKDGEALLLRSMEDESKYPEYHGQEFPWIGFEELTQWETDKAYKLMFSCCRPTAPGIPTRIRATTNPSGVGHHWVKKRFKLPTSYQKPIRIPGETTRVPIEMKLEENFLLLHTDPDYPKKIKQAASTPAQAEAWLKGSWEITTGGMFDDIWERDIHVIPNIKADQIPKGWRIYRCYDHGQSHPFAVGWFAESNGEAVKIGGKEYGRVRGDKVMLAEWYGTTGNDNEGLRLSARRIARGILDREEDLGIGPRVNTGPADTEIWSKDSRGTGRAPVDDMEDIGVLWERADKTPGSRQRGFQMLRTLMEDAKPGPDGTRERPGIFICQGCRYWLEFVPTAPRGTKDPDDLPDKYPDHMCDMTRYFVSWEAPVGWRKSF
jgi:hypothetical protein